MSTSPATEPKTAGPPKFNRRWLWWSGGLAGAAILAAGGIVTAAYTAVGTNIVRGVTVAGQPVGGQDRLTAVHQLEQRWQAFQQSAFQFTAGGRTMTILATADTSSETEVILKTVDFDPAVSVNRAMTFGRRGQWWQRVRERTSGFLGRPHELGFVSADAQVIGDTLVAKFGDLVKPATNAGLDWTSGDHPVVTASTTGQGFDFVNAVHRVVAEAHQLNSEPIIIAPLALQPTIASTPALNTLAEKAPAVLNRAPLILTLDNKQWTIDRSRLQELLGFAGTTAKPRLGFDINKTTAYLATIANGVNVKAANAKFTVVDGRVQEFQASATGVTLDPAATLAAMQNELIDLSQPTAGLVVAEEKPLTDTVATNNLGITELVAEATTNFKNSPTNRRFNLGYGAQLLNGLLIQPGEEFSLVKALGKIDGQHGWKPELVIKGPKITPEFGGGLCQVATTMFRTVLNAGLPIIERHNHSLRISYYEPPIGLDATIYEPKPDLRFTNDYATPLLLQTNVSGTLLTFSFYGTKDGRTITIPEPKVYNRVPIPAAKTVEVDTLKPGQTECQKPGHPGADATATYTVTKADGTSVTQTFQSHYRATGIVCQVGRKPTSVPAPTTNTNTSAPDTNTSTNTNTAVPDINVNTDTNTNTSI